MKLLVASAIATLLAACSQDAQPVNPRAAPPGSDAVKVFTDPVTGELRDPTEAEQRAMAQAEAAQKASQTSQQKDREIVLPDGSVVIVHAPDSEAPLKACPENQGEVAVSHDCSPAQTGAPR